MHLALSPFHFIEWIQGKEEYGWAIKQFSGIEFNQIKDNFRLKKILIASLNINYFLWRIYYYSHSVPTIYNPQLSIISQSQMIETWDVSFWCFSFKTWLRNNIQEHEYCKSLALLIVIFDYETQSWITTSLSCLMIRL